MKHRLIPLSIGISVLLVTVYSIFRIDKKQFEYSSGFKSTGNVVDLNNTGSSVILQTDIEQTSEEGLMLITSSEKYKLEYLRKVKKALTRYGKIDYPPVEMGDSKSLIIAITALLLDESDDVVNNAASILSLLALSKYQNQDSINYNLVENKQLENVLLQKIHASDMVDTNKGVVIDAYSWIYPPNETIVSAYNSILSESNISKSSSLKAVFAAFSKYKELHKYQIPESTLQITRELIDHPSESVKSDVITVLRENLGADSLPVLLDQLKKSKTSALTNSILMNIVLVDQGEETISKISQIGSESKSVVKQQRIEKFIRPNAIEYYKKIAAASKE